MTVIELKNVTKEYERGGEIIRALENAKLTVDPGVFVAVMGPSGSGKSTMLNLMGLLDEPTTGTIRLDGRDVANYSARERTTERRRSIGFVFQDFYLLPTLSALENVALPAQLYNDGPTDPKARAVELLELVGLDDRLDHYPGELSGGQKQRVAIARALVNRPRVLLADEPTGNLDTKTSEKILEEFVRLSQTEGVALVAVTHDPQVAEYADYTIELIDGAIQ